MINKISRELFIKSRDGSTVYYLPESSSLRRAIIEVFEEQEDASTNDDYLKDQLGQFTRNYTQTVKRAADNKRRYAPGKGSIPPVLLSGVSKGACPLAHDFACKV